MLIAYDSKLMKKADSETINEGVPSLVLVKRAATEILNAYTINNGKIGIVVGKGNNAADGFQLAILYKEKRNIDVDIIYLTNDLNYECNTLKNECNNQRINLIKYNSNIDFNEYNFIYDAIFGNGFHGNLEGIYKEVVDKINESKSFVISIDIPTGLNATNGLGEDAVNADITIVISNLKTGNLLNYGKDKCGIIKLVDIGIKQIESNIKVAIDTDTKQFINYRHNHSNKGNYGYVGLIGGCDKYSGAIKLSNLAISTLKCGAGVVKLGIPDSIRHDVVPYTLESTLFLFKSINEQIKYDENQLIEFISNLKCIGVGPGWGKPNNDYARILEFLFKNYKGRLVIDADGLNTLSENIELLNIDRKCELILTPHLKEFSRLTNYSIQEIEENIINISQSFAKKYNIILLLKGPSTLITDGNQIIISTTGCPGMATAGSGDVLLGFLVGMLGQNFSCIDCTWFASFLCGKAGELAQEKYTDISMTSSNTIEMIHDAIKQLRVINGI
ncbi:MAG: NAD(P)H-hydrate dehydratase [Clostridia bacterium]|nr:NAD(P)H-hydrate dehydratase [Clostridia bacterium]